MPRILTLRRLSTLWKILNAGNMAIFRSHQPFHHLRGSIFRAVISGSRGSCDPYGETAELLLREAWEPSRWCGCIVYGRHEFPACFSTVPLL